ncbi:hypothetical protein F383_38519 [Gossypium arboreum]|uniref:Uncharacterized protein n=1 Tax=Gossypium arboreum TaxID=29729 RepID=A0A0B0MFG0_GOSAR|nr:hypothetical protein F383_38519 [Gossypium arboreum]
MGAFVLGQLLDELGQ